jgi:chromosome condensin MukBEF complex kleisin-like MukF subunit
MPLEMNSINAAYGSTDMGVFIQKCIDEAQTEGRDGMYMTDLLAIKDWVDSGGYAIKSTDKTCDEEVQWYRDQQEDIQIAGDKLQETLEKFKEATGLD